MANNEKKSFNERPRKANPVEACVELMENRLDTAWDSATCTITNRMIEDTIMKYILKNMASDENRKFMVQCGWNRGYDRVIETGKQDGSDPFVISIYAQVTNRERGASNNVKAGNRIVTQTYNRILRQASNAKQKQIKLMLSKQLNAVISSIAILNKRGELTWEACGKKGKYVECPLDPIKVLEYCFKMDDQSDFDKFCFDIIDVDYRGKRKGGKINKEDRNPEFTMRIAKVRIARNFKHANRDRFEFIARRRR